MAYQSSPRNYGVTINDVIHFEHGNHVTLIEVVKELGRGAFGEVYLALDERKHKFAIKKVKCYDINSYYSIAQELEMLTVLRNPNIIKLYSVDFIGDSCVFVMEYCQDGCLNDRLDFSVPKLTQLVWMGQLASALSYLHSKKIVHRDLKPENVLLKGDDLKLADFGIARKFYGMSCGRQQHSTDPNEYLSDYLNADDQMGTFAGTPYWIAPEVFDHCYDEKADIFSLGIIFYAIITRSYFVYENKKYYGAFVTHYRNQVGIGSAMSEQGKQLELDFINSDNVICDVAIIEIVRKMLLYKAVDRLSAIECLNQLEQSQMHVLDSSLLNNSAPLINKRRTRSSKDNTKPNRTQTTAGIDENRQQEKVHQRKRPSERSHRRKKRPSSRRDDGHHQKRPVSGGDDRNRKTERVNQTTNQTTPRRSRQHTPEQRHSANTPIDVVDDKTSPSHRPSRIDRPTEDQTTPKRVHRRSNKSPSNRAQHNEIRPSGTDAQVENSLSRSSYDQSLNRPSVGIHHNENRPSGRNHHPPIVQHTYQTPPINKYGKNQYQKQNGPKPDNSSPNSRYLIDDKHDSAQKTVRKFEKNHHQSRFGGLFDCCGRRQLRQIDHFNYVNDTALPTQSRQVPASNRQAPASNKQAPASNKQAPAFNRQAPASNRQTPANIQGSDASRQVRKPSRQSGSGESNWARTPSRQDSNDTRKPDRLPTRQRSNDTRNQGPTQVNQCDIEINRALDPPRKSGGGGATTGNFVLSSQSAWL